MPSIIGAVEDQGGLLTAEESSRSEQRNNPSTSYDDVVVPQEEIKEHPAYGPYADISNNQNATNGQTGGYEEIELQTIGRQEEGNQGKKKI